MNFLFISFGQNCKIAQVLNQFKILFGIHFREKAYYSLASFWRVAKILKQVFSRCKEIKSLKFWGIIQHVLQISFTYSTTILIATQTPLKSTNIV